MEHVPEAGAEDEDVGVPRPGAEIAKDGGEVGLEGSPEEIELDAVVGDGKMVVAVAAEKVGLDGVHGAGVEKETEEGEDEQAGLGISGDEDPGAVEEVGRVGAGEALEAAGEGGCRWGPLPEGGGGGGGRGGEPG